MYGRSFFGARYFGPRYWGDGGEAAPEPPPPEPGIAGAPIRLRPRRAEPAFEVFRASIRVSGGGRVRVSARVIREETPMAEVVTALSAEVFKDLWTDTLWPSNS